MKEIRFEKGGGQVQKTGSAGAAPKNGGVKKAGKQPVDVKLPALSDDMLRTLTTLLKDPNTRENVKGILKNMGWTPSQIQGFIDLQSNKKSQGASSKLRTEVGYKPIGNAPKPKAAKAPAADGTSGMGAFHGRYDNVGDASVTGVDTNSAKFKARVIAQKTAQTNLDDLRVQYRVGGGGASEAEFKAYCQRNGIAYTPPKSTKWLGN